MVEHLKNFLKGRRNVKFIDRSHLNEWVDFLNETKFKNLPGIDRCWFDSVMDCIEITRLHPKSNDDVLYAGASIFYKIIKNHYRIDGNKRSSIIVLYLFFIRNDLQIQFTQKWIILIAEFVAKSESSQCEEIIENLTEQFRGRM